jgi:hypothetical protein
VVNATTLAGVIRFRKLGNAGGAHLHGGAQTITMFCLVPPSRVLELTILYLQQVYSYFHCGVRVYLCFCQCEMALLLFDDRMARLMLVA